MPPRINFYTLRDLNNGFADKMVNLAIRNELLVNLDTPIDLSTITDVNLSGYPITDLTGIEQLTGLERISLAETQVTDLSPLLTMTDLLRVNLYGLPITEELEAQIQVLENVGVYVELRISSALEADLRVFTDNENSTWPLWDCCGGSTPTVELDDEVHGNVAQFVVGAQSTVNGFISRSENTDTPAPFDASAILTNGVLQFDMKVVTAPNDSAAPWILKVEADGAASNTGDYAMTSSNEGQAPVTGEWQTYTFNLADLEAAGLDVSAIDVIMVFPAWGAGEGAVYRIDNLKIHDPTAVAGTPGSNTLFKDSTAPGWVVWDCCGGTTPTIEEDDAAHGMTAEFVIGAQPTVMGLNARVEFVEDPAPIDATSIVANGVLQFDMKVITAPNNTDSTWILKVESDGAATNTGDYAMTSSNEGQAPVTGEWQTYTFNLSDLEAAGLDVSAIDVIMVFPAWGTGEGAVYRLDNIMIFEP